MRNPLRSEAEAFRFLGVVIVGAAVIIAASFINTWLGVAVAVIVFAGLVWWLRQEPVPGAADAAPVVTSSTPAGTHRVLVVAPPGTETVTVPNGAELLVVVPTLASKTQSLTGAVDDSRPDAEPRIPIASNPGRPSTPLEARSTSHTPTSTGSDPSSRAATWRSTCARRSCGTARARC